MSTSIQHSLLQSIKQLYGSKLRALDGEIGHVKDFYFDDQKWGVRYVVVDTGSWLSGRLVLISPHAFGNFHEYRHSPIVDLTRKQIENSPPIETHKPVSRQYEAEYYRYYGYPSYWNGIELWGGAGFPVVPPPNLMPGGKESRFGSLDSEDPHLRSTKELAAYYIQASDGEIGHVTDFMIDDTSWEIRHLIVETGHWFAGKEIAISPAHIDRISYEESKVFVTMTKQSIVDAPEFHVPSPSGRPRDASA
jgi:sporulation protein YlmC with PRC-barrel domain